MKTLRRVNGTFNLFNEGRIDGNKRRYVLQAVKNMIASERTKQGLRLGELYGYFGHGRRALTNKNDLSEVEVITVGGKPLLIENNPACRTIAIDVNDDGDVSFTQEILASPEGKRVEAMLDSHAGGWSWVVYGDDGANFAAPKIFYGFDYVFKPNFISREHTMFESSEGSSLEQLMLQNLAALGESEPRLIMESWQSQSDPINFTAQAESMALSSLLIEKNTEISHLKQQQDSFLQALNDLPVTLNASQKAQLLSSNSEDVGTVLKVIMESVSGVNLPFFHASKTVVKMPPAKPFAAPDWAMQLSDQNRVFLQK